LRGRARYFGDQLLDQGILRIGIEPNPVAVLSMKLRGYDRIGIREALQLIGISLGMYDLECNLVPRLSNQRRAVDADHGKLSLRGVQGGGTRVVANIMALA
jgi:hypothetical protein